MVVWLGTPASAQGPTSHHARRADWSQRHLLEGDAADDSRFGRVGRNSGRPSTSPLGWASRTRPSETKRLRATPDWISVSGSRSRPRGASPTECFTVVTLREPHAAPFFLFLA